MAGEFFQLASQGGGETVSDMTGECVEELALIFREGADVFAEFLEFIVTCLFKAVAQGGDEGERYLREEFVVKTVDLFMDDAFAFGEPLGAGRYVACGSRQIVDIEERDAGQFANGAFDIARDCKIDDDHRTAGAMLHDEFEIGACGDGMRRRGCGDEDIHLAGNLPTVWVRDGKPTDAIGERLGVLACAAGDGDGSTGIDQGTRRRLGGFTRPENEGGAVTNRTQLAAADLDGGKTTGNDGGGKPGFATNAHSYGERLGDEGIQKRTGGAGLPGLVPRGGEMDTNFGIARDQGVKTGADTEDMGDGGVIDETIEVRPVGKLEIVGAGEEAENRIGSLGGVAGPNVELGAVGGRENDGFVDGVGTNELGQRTETMRRVHPEPLADGKRCGSITDADDDQGRFQWLTPYLYVV